MTHSLKPIFHSFLEPEIKEFYMSEMSYFLLFTMHYINSHNFVSYEDI